METIESAFDVFIDEASIHQVDEYDNYSFELKTTVKKFLDPNRISEYLKIVHAKDGVALAQSVLDYVLIVRAKNLMMTSCIHLFKKKPEKVQLDFDGFNNHYKQYAAVFETIPGCSYKPGQDIQRKNPLPAIFSKTNKGIVNSVDDSLVKFLEKHGLIELEGLFKWKGILLEDLLEMTDDEMLEAGIQAYRHRKILIKGALEMKGKLINLFSLSKGCL